MAITSYSELQAAINNWSERSDATDQVKEFIALAESRLNRLLGAVELDATLAATPGSNTVSISLLSLERPISLWATVFGNERPIQLQAPGSFPLLDITGLPEIASVDGDNLVFSRPMDQAYPLRLRYRQRFALSNAATSNWLLEHNPDLYLAASMMWGAGYREDTAMGATWKAVLDEGIAEVRSQIAASKRGMARVDPALSRRCYPRDLYRLVP